MIPMTTSNHDLNTASFLKLPVELRLKIYEYALAVPNNYINQPLIVISDRGNVFTARNRYRALSMCPSWVGEDGTARKLLAVNHQIHDEAEDYLYSHHTLFFRNSFDLDRLGDFIDSLSPTACRRIRSVGFEVFFFVHTQMGVPKRTLKQYESAARLLSVKLPEWRNVLFYLDPQFYYPAAAVGGRARAVRGVLDLVAKFVPLCRDVTLHPLPASDSLLLRQAQQLLWCSSSLGKPMFGEDMPLTNEKCSALEMLKRDRAIGRSELPEYARASHPRRSTASWTW